MRNPWFAAFDQHAAHVDDLDAELDRIAELTLALDAANWFTGGGTHA